MPRRILNHYLFGSDTIRELVEADDLTADDLTLQEVAAELDSQWEDSLFSAWRRSGRATIRRARGH